MKYLIAILILCSTVSASVRNTGSTTRDSVCIYVTCLDSVGKMSTCDSFYVRVIKSGTNAVAFSDSGTLAMTGMDSISGKSEYYYHRAVADIDGSGADGEYILSVIAKKTAGSGWPTPNTRIFEIANNLVHDSLILKRLGVYNTTASTTTNDYGAVEFSSTGDSSFAFVVKNTGIAGAKFKGSAFKLYSKTHSGIIAIGGATGTATSGGIYALDSSSSGAGFKGRNTNIGGSGGYFEDGAADFTSLGPTGFGATGKILNSDYNSDFLTSSLLSDDAAREIASHILKDTTKRIGVKGGLGDSVLTPIPTVTVGDVTLAAGQFTKIKDTVNIAANIVAARDSAGLGVRKDSSGLAYRVDSSGLSVRKDSSGLAYRSQPDSITQKQAKIILGDTTKRVFPGILNDTTKRIKFSNDSVVAIDPIRTVAATVAGGATSAALQVAQDSLNALTAITRADSNLTKAVRDTAHIIDSIVKLILPLATQARDTLLTFPTWLAARFDTMMVAAGWADSSRTTNTYLNDADTVRVYKGENLWFKYIRLHPAHVPGYRPDSTRGRGW